MLLRRILGQALGPAPCERLYISSRVAVGDQRRVAAAPGSPERSPVSHSSHPPPHFDAPGVGVGAAPGVTPGGSPAAGSAIGTRLVLGLVILALGLAAFAVWFQWNQTRRCLAFYGAAATRSIQAAPRTELWSLAAGGPGLRVASRLDVSRAPGLVHLRRGLIEDVNFRWDVTFRRDVTVGSQAGAAAGEDKLPPGAWDEAIAFFATADASTPAAVVAFDLDEPGFATVVGRPGRIGLGPIAPGLRKWIEATRSGFLPRKSGF
jgi:hypothetical protein